jgi:hypothetical protein
MSITSENKSISENKPCNRYRQRKDRVCELNLFNYFITCDACSHFKEPNDCLKMQREVDREKFATLLNSFPPYHGESWNYTKQEVEDWLAKAKAVWKTHI